MPDMNASYEMPLDFIAFLGILIHNWWTFMPEELLYLHQIFTDCVSNWCAYVGMFDSTYPHQTFTECLSNQFTRFDS